MKKILSVILLAAVTTSAYTQKPNERLTRLEEFLQKESSVCISHKQLNCTGRGIEHQWYAWFSEITSKTPRFNFDEKVSEAARRRLIESYDSISAARHQRVVTMLDSTRLTFALLGKDASESYTYEYHKGEIDTIKYTLAFREEGDTLLSPPATFTYRWELIKAREIANFDYSRGHNSRQEGNVETGQYTHLYFIPNGITWDDMKPFDIEAFEAQIEPVLKSFNKLKGAKTYPVYWRHDEGFEDEVSEDGGLVQKTQGSKKHSFGLTTGTHYFIPAKHKEEAEALYKQLIAQAYDYINNHPEQPYRYKFTSRFSYINLEDVVEGVNYDDDDDEYFLSCMRDDDGFHILSLRNKGYRWVPRNWAKLKSYINGEEVYLKGMEPKEDKE